MPLVFSILYPTSLGLKENILSFTISKSKTVFCIILFIFALIGRLDAENPVEDSLRSVLLEQPPDSDRVNALNKLALKIAYTKYQEALPLYEEAIQLATELSFDNGLKYGLSGLSELENWLGSYGPSMEHALSAFELAQKSNDSATMARNMISIGLINLNLYNYDNALSALERAKGYYGTNYRGKLIAMHNMASVNTSMGDTAGAIRQYRANLKAMETNPFGDIYAATYNNLGRLFDPLTEGDSAIAYFEKALYYKRKRPNPGSISNTLLNVAEILLIQGKYEAAKVQLDEVEPLVYESGMRDRLVQFHRFSGKLHQKLKQYQKAAHHFEMLAMNQDSMYEPQMLEQTARMEASFNNQRKQQQIELLKAAKLVDESKNTRLQWIIAAIVIGLLTAIILLLVLVVRGRERNRVLRLLKSKNEEIKRQQHEIMLSNEALAMQNMRLEDLNREKDGLIGIVAHDIRAPLNRSAALVELIANSGELNEDQRRFASMIKKVNEDGGRLIQDLLELNAFENDQSQIEFKPCNILDIVNVVMHGFHEAADNKAITLGLKTPDKAPIISTDEKHVTRILDNLISNAIKFTPRGKHIEISLRANKEGTIIDIKDQGPGISEDEQKKMFQKFMRLSPRPTAGESSTGLGLSIVKTLADQIDAEVRVKSALGAGSTFSLILRPKSLNHLESKQL